MLFPYCTIIVLRHYRGTYLDKVVYADVRHYRSFIEVFRFELKRMGDYYRLIRREKKWRKKLIAILIDELGWLSAFPVTFSHKKGDNDDEIFKTETLFLKVSQYTGWGR